MKSCVRMAVLISVAVSVGAASQQPETSNVMTSPDQEAAPVVAAPENETVLITAAAENEATRIATPPAQEDALVLTEQMLSQVHCIKQRREGSRVVQNRCQTLAQWKQEIEAKYMRRSLIRARGRAASWETSP